MVLLHEDLVTLPQAAKRFGVHYATIFRWAQRGIRRARLETVVIGGRRYTSFQALERFAKATTEARDRLQRGSHSSTQRQRQIAAAEAELNRLGIGNQRGATSNSGDD